jgi:hypothetical protein
MAAHSPWDRSPYVAEDYECDKETFASFPVDRQVQMLHVYLCEYNGLVASLSTEWQTAAEKLYDLLDVALSNPLYEEPLLLT